MAINFDETSKMVFRPSDPTLTEITKAINSMRIYLGSLEYSSKSIQRIFLKKLNENIELIGSKTGMEYIDIFNVLEIEARKLGTILPN